MSDLVNGAAALIDKRGRESLEVTLARVTFELSGALDLSFWRAFARSDGIWLRRSVALPEGPDGDTAVEADVPLAAASALLREAYQARACASLRDEATGLRRYVLPAPGEQRPLGLFEIVTEREIDGEQLSGLTGMLRIFRSPLAAPGYADTDELTGFSNRRAFDEQMRRIAASQVQSAGARRADNPLKAHIGVADIDLFRQINDRFGYPYGDEVLLLVSNLMRRVFRDTDKLFRFGDEPFVILMPGCALDDALLAFERFRSTVKAYPFPKVGRVTVSVGVASLFMHDTVSSAFDRADQALHVAKREGGNRVVIYEAIRHTGATGAR